MNTFIKPFFPPSHQSKLYGMVKKIVFSRSRWYQSDSVGIPLGLRASLVFLFVGLIPSIKSTSLAQGSVFSIFSSLKRASFVKNKKARFVPKWTSFVIPLGLLHEPRMGAHSKHKVHLVAQGPVFFIHYLTQASLVRP